MLSTPPYDSSISPLLCRTVSQTLTQRTGHILGWKLWCALFLVRLFPGWQLGPSGLMGKHSCLFLSQPILSQQIWPEGSCSFVTIPVTLGFEKTALQSSLISAALYCIHCYSNEMQSFFFTLFWVPAWLTRKTASACWFSPNQSGDSPVEWLRKILMQIVPVRHTAGDLFEDSSSQTSWALFSHSFCKLWDSARPADSQACCRTTDGQASRTTLTHGILHVHVRGCALRVSLCVISWNYCSQLVLTLSLD